MKFGNWTDIQSKLRKKIEEIFNNQNIMELSDYQKREMIFDYLCSTLSYDENLLEEIKTGHAIRDLYSELMSVIDNNIGICNAISQYYKLLLEQVGIKSYAVICDDGTEVNHQLTVVYDSEKDIYSFDDVTSVIVGRGPKEVFFDYDLEMANKQGQGNKEILDNNKWIMYPDSLLSLLVGREKSVYEDISKLPTNISVVREKYHY